MFILNKQPGQPQEIFRTKKLKRQNLPYRPMYTYIYMIYLYRIIYICTSSHNSQSSFSVGDSSGRKSPVCFVISFISGVKMFVKLLWRDAMLRFRAMAGGASASAEEKKTEQKRKHTVDGRESCTRRKEPSMIIYLHPGRLTRNIIMEAWKIIFLSKWVICRFHVNLPRCINWCRMSSINIIKAISWIYLPLPGCWLGKPPG